MGLPFSFAAALFAKKAVLSSHPSGQHPSAQGSPDSTKGKAPAMRLAFLFLQYHRNRVLQRQAVGLNPAGIGMDAHPGCRRL